MSQEKVVVTIDLRHKSLKSQYVARLIWQELFNIYWTGGGNLDRMDNLLCDLRRLIIFCTELGPYESLYCRPCESLYWEWGVNGYTNLQSTATSPDCYKIEWPLGGNKITITHTHTPATGA